MTANEFRLSLVETLHDLFPKATRKNKKLQRTGKYTSIELKVEAVSKRLLEPYQRVGVWSCFRTELKVPAMSQALGLNAKFTWFNGQFRERNTSNLTSQYYWSALDTQEDLDKLCRKIARNFEEDAIEQHFQKIEQGTVLERRLWAMIKSDFKGGDWAVPNTAQEDPFYWYPSDDLVVKRSWARGGYIYCLLQRNAFEAASKALDMVELSEGMQEKLQAILQEKQAKGALEVPLPIEQELVQPVVVEEDEVEAVHFDQLSRSVQYLKEPVIGTVRNFWEMEWNTIMAQAQTDVTKVDFKGFGFEQKKNEKFPKLYEAGEQIDFLKHCRSTMMLPKDVVEGMNVEWIQHLKWSFSKLLHWSLDNLTSLEGLFDDFNPKTNVDILERYPKVDSLYIDIREKDIPAFQEMPGLERLKALRLSCRELDKEFRDLVKSKRLKGVQYLDIQRGDMKPNAATWMGKKEMFPELKVLKLGGMTGAAEKKFFPPFAENFPKLEDLTLNFDHSMQDIRLPKTVEHLKIRPSFGSFKNFIELNSDLKLKTLDMNGFGLDVEGCTKLVNWEAVKTLEQLTIHPVKHFREVLETLVDLPAENLRYLAVDIHEIEDDAMPALAQLIASFPKLESLVFTSYKAGLTKEGIQPLLKACHQLKAIHSDIPCFFEGILEQDSLPNLSHLACPQMKLSLQQCASFTASRFPSLQYLNLDMAKVKEGGLAYIANASAGIVGLNFGYSLYSERLAFTEGQGLRQLKYLEMRVKDEDKASFSSLKERGVRFSWV